MASAAGNGTATEVPVQWVTVRLADGMYAINVMQVQEVLRLVEFMPDAGVPVQVPDVIELKGESIQVIDPRQCLGLKPREPGDTSRIVIVAGGGIRVGLLVDGVADVIALPVSQIVPASTRGDEYQSACVLGIAVHADRTLNMLDLDKLLAKGESHCLAGA